MIQSAFLGTPSSALPALVALTDVSDVVLIVTRPDQPHGRSRSPRPSPVRTHAEELGIPVATPRDPGELIEVISTIYLDIAIVAAFGMIIPTAALELPARGMINVHFSLLPRWRGAAPVERAMLAADAVTGVTLMQMNAGLDTGPLLATWPTAIRSDETAGALTARLAIGGAELLANQLGAIVGGDVDAIPQPEEGTNYAPMLSTAEAKVDWALPAYEVERRIRAFNPRPGAHTTWRGERFKIHLTKAASAEMTPGAIRLLDGQALVGCGEGSVELVVVQPPGAKQMASSAWARGVQGDPGHFE